METIAGAAMSTQAMHDAIKRIILPITKKLPSYHNHCHHTCQPTPIERLPLEQMSSRAWIVAKSSVACDLSCSDPVSKKFLWVGIQNVKP
jgi:hypothetical protein